MIMRALTSDGDWSFGKGLADYNQAEPAVEENILTWLQSWVNNCFFALKDGVDWQNLLDVGQAANLVDSLRANILQRYGVVGVNSMDVRFDRRTRHIAITANITTIYSQSFQLELTQISGVSNG